MKSINLTPLMIGLIFFSLFIGSIISQPAQAAQGKTVWIPIAVGDITIFIPAMPFIHTANLAHSSGGYNLTWSAVANASYYQLIITDENGEQRIVEVTGTSYVLSGLSLGSNKIEVKVCNATDRCGGGYYVGSAIINSKVTYQHTDMLGSPVLETDDQGQVVSRSVYDPFGKRLGGEKEGIGYTGHLQDEDLGLTYMQARYYDPVIGRFYSNDPVGAMGHIASGNSVHGFNRFTYANNNPYKYVDPDGEFAIQLTAIFVGTVIGGAAEYMNNPDATLNSIGRSAVVGGAIGLATSLPGMGALGTMAMGAGANASGEMVNQIATGSFDGRKVLTAGVVGVVGGAVAKGAAKLAIASRGLPNNTATQATTSMTESTSQRVLAGSKSLSTTPGNRAVSEVKLGGAYGAGAASGTQISESICKNNDGC
ncbi:RHS repeat domain-containing protein [Moritella sp. 36]|uniref:RHS repeat domain-containing protein n=1 Tax=Moritella sp. 36 TaxID=2746233 RepID=UPI0021027DD3|nr:RHS repeat-associated core domain-containing protein [Moritella sp. 36]